ncbi:MAG: membrane protein insertion efficiency factor YidD [Patescibacteria group bacterium]|jgi:hypothetical protein
MPKKRINKLVLLPRRAVLLLVKAYQKTLSPDHGLFAYKHPYGYCKHFPTCSDYTFQAVGKYGVVKGGIKSAKRVLRCNPHSQGGYDPID